MARLISQHNIQKYNRQIKNSRQMNQNMNIEQISHYSHQMGNSYHRPKVIQYSQQTVPVQQSGVIYQSVKHKPQPQIRYGSRSPIRNVSVSPNRVYVSHHQQPQSPIRVSQNNTQYPQKQIQSPIRNVNVGQNQNDFQYHQQSPIVGSQYRQQSPMTNRTIIRQNNSNHHGIVNLDNMKVSFVQQIEQQPQHYNSVVEQSVPILATPSKPISNHNVMNSNGNHNVMNSNGNYGQNLLSNNQQELVIIKDQNSNHIKIDYQIFGNNLINKLLEFHDKLMPLGRSNFRDLETVNQYDVVIQDLNQELAYKNQQIQELQDKLNEVEGDIKKENNVLRGALANSQQLQQVSGLVDEQVFQDLEHYRKQCREIEKYFQKEIQCLQGYLEIKLIGFMERIRKEYQKIINEYGVQLAQYKQTQGSIDVYKHDILMLQNDIRILNDNLQKRDQMIINLRSQPPKKVIVHQQVQQPQPQPQPQPQQQQQPQIDIKPYEDQISQLQMDIQYLQEQLSNQPKQEIDEGQFEEYRQEIAALKAEIDLLRSQLEEKDRYYNIEIGNYQDKLQEYENRLIIQQDEYKKLRDQFELQLKEKDDEIERLKRDYDQLKLEFQEIQEEYEEEEEKLKEDFTNNEAKWKSKITILEQEIESLKLKLKDVQQDVKQSTEEIQNYERLVQEKTRMVYNLQEKINEMEGSSSQNNQMIAQNRRSISDLQSININYKKELQKYKDDLDEQQNQIKVYENKLKGKDRDLREMQQQLNELMEKRQAQDGDSNLNQKIAELNRQNFQKQMELDQKHDELLKKNLEINRLKIDISQLEETIKKQDDQIRHQRRELEQRITDLDNHEKQQLQQMNNRAERKSVRKSVIQYGLNKQ